MAGVDVTEGKDAGGIVIASHKYLSSPSLSLKHHQTPFEEQQRPDCGLQCRFLDTESCAQILFHLLLCNRHGLCRAHGLDRIAGKFDICLGHI